MSSKVSASQCAVFPRVAGGQGVGGGGEALKQRHQVFPAFGREMRDELAPEHQIGRLFQLVEGCCALACARL